MILFWVIKEIEWESLKTIFEIIPKTSCILIGSILISFASPSAISFTNLFGQFLLKSRLISCKNPNFEINKIIKFNELKSKNK